MPVICGTPEMVDQSLEFGFGEGVRGFGVLG